MSERIRDGMSRDPFESDEGGLRPPPEYRFWQKAWWWFDFLILVKLARLRFIAILVVIGVIITQWDLLVAYYDKWTRSDETAGASTDSEYFCPMHPAVVRENNREKCPICFMPLSKRKKGVAVIEALPAGVVNRVQLSPYRVALAGVQTWELKHEALTKEITAVGYVEFDERNQRTISARVPGRIDELLVNETGTRVEADQVVALIYSPDLIVAAQELVAAKRAANPTMLASARTRLELLGFDAKQLDEIQRSNEPSTHFEIRSPISGHVIKKYVVEGQYVEEGSPLYDVVDLSTVWIQAQIHEDDLVFLPAHSSHPDGLLEDGPEVVATTRANPEEHFRGKLTFIYPHVDQATRTVTVRCELPNRDHTLRPGSTAAVHLMVSPLHISQLAAAAQAHDDGKVLAVPEGSVIDTGRQTIVYREAEPNLYEGVEVKLGPRMENSAGVVFFPVLEGLQPGARIVTSGSFLVDAETRLNPAAGSIYFGGSSGSSGPSRTTVRSTTPEDPDAKIRAALAKLPPADRALAETQEFCAVLTDNRLGSMGTPIKLVFDGQPVFICCDGCRESANNDAQQILNRLKESARRPGARE